MYEVSRKPEAEKEVLALSRLKAFVGKQNRIAYLEYPQFFDDHRKITL